MLLRLLSFLGVDVGEMSFYKLAFPAGTRYQFVTIPAGATATIYAFRNWGQDFRAFVDKVGLGPDALPWNLVRFIWSHDGEVVENYNYQIASVRKPKQFEDPYIARTEIVWLGVNNDVVPHVFEVLCDGKLVMLPASQLRYGVRG